MGDGGRIEGWYGDGICSPTREDGGFTSTRRLLFIDSEIRFNPLQVVRRTPAGDIST